MQWARFCIIVLVAAVGASATGTPRDGQLSAPDQSSRGSIPGECHDPGNPDLRPSYQIAGSAPAAELLRVCADALSHEGAWKKAEQFYESALALDRQAENRLAESLDLAGIGHSELRLGYPLKAEDYYRQALAIQQKISPNSLATARILNGLGQAMGMYGDVVKAEEYFRQAQVILKILGHRGDLDFAISLNGLGYVTELRGHSAKAEVWHRQALSIQQKLAPYSLDVADTLDYLGRASYLESHYQRAQDYYNKSLALRREFPGPSFDTALSINGLGNVAYNQNELAKAEDSYRYALSITKDSAPEGLITTKLLANLFLVYYRKGDLKAAEEYQGQALAIQNRVAPEGLDVAVSLKNFGDIFFRKGDLSKAEEHGIRALVIRQKLNPGSSSVATSQNKLGEIAVQQGNLIKAENYFAQALSIREKIDPTSMALASSLTFLGGLEQQRGDSTKAEQYYRRAVDIEEKLPAGRQSLPNTLMDLGLLADDLGQTVKAEHYCRKALAAQKKLTPNNPALASIFNALGVVMFHRGNLPEAENYQRQALAFQRRSNALGAVASLYFLGMISHARGDLVLAEDLEREALVIQEKLATGTTSHLEIQAELASILGDRGELKDAAELYERSLNALENQISHLGGGSQSRSGFRAARGSLYRKYINLRMQMGQPELAFRVAERWRAQALLEMLATAKIDIRKGIDPQLREQERRLQQSWLTKSNVRLQLIAGHSTEQQLAAANVEIGELSRRYQELREQILQRSAEYSALINPKSVTVSEVQQLLDSHTLLLEYSLGRDRSFLWAIGAEHFSYYELPKGVEIERQARNVYQLLTAPGQIIPGETRPQKRARLERARQAYWTASAGLSRMILAPAQTQLKDKRLLIVSEGALQYIPFAALPNPSRRGISQDRGPLIVKHEIAHLPSASVLAALREHVSKRSHPPSEVIVFADPVFDKEDTRVNSKGRVTGVVREREALFADESQGLNSINTLARLHRDGVRLSRLPFSREEAKGILAVAPPGKTTAALDFAANLDLATSPKLAEYRIVHFATHGILDSKNPELSGLVFSMVDREGKPRNAFLDLQSIYNLNLRADLVVLSACQTALGKDLQGEGIVGLTRGFMYAGASKVIASLWTIDDARTAELMKRVYKEMEQHQLTPAAALQKAQMDIWRRNPVDLPFYWAAFQLQGDYK